MSKSRMSPRLEQVGEIVADHLTSIQSLWKPGAQVLVIVRAPGNDAADFTLGDLSLEDGIALLKRRIDDPEGLVQEGVPGVDEGFLSPGGDS